MRTSTLAPILGVALAVLPTRGADGPVRCGVEMRNVALRVSDGVVLHVRALDGEFVSRSQSIPPLFDDPTSYTVRVRGADISIDAASLTSLVRDSLAAHPSSLRDVTIRIQDGRLQAAGTLRKGVSVPFSMSASVSATGDGLVRMHATTLKAAGVPVKGLLDLLGLDVADLMKMPPGTGIRADGDDLLMDAAALLPPPRMEGRLRSVAVSGDRLVLRMNGAGAPPERPRTLPSPSAKNYLYFYGGSIRFGKLTMTDADMQLIDADPSSPFDFYPARYEAQLVAGYSRNTKRKGLQVFMPDYARAANGGILRPPRLP
jgi:hypothetical protein